MNAPQILENLIWLIIWAIVIGGLIALLISLIIIWYLTHEREEVATFEELDLTQYNEEEWRL